MNLAAAAAVCGVAAAEAFRTRAAERFRSRPLGAEFVFAIVARGDGRGWILCAIHAGGDVHLRSRFIWRTALQPEHGGPRWLFVVY